MWSANVLYQSSHSRSFGQPWTCFSRPATAHRPSKKQALTLTCSYSHNLEPWQQAKLEEAFIAGKRKIKVNDLCKDVGLERHVVLSWFKQQDALPEHVRKSIHEARLAAVQADADRQALLEVEEQQKAAAAPTADTRERQKQFYAKKRLAWDVEATFEKVYAAHRGRPNDDIINSLCSLYKMPRKKIVAWFADKRAQDQEEKRSKSQPRRAQQSPFDGVQDEHMERQEG